MLFLKFIYDPLFFPNRPCSLADVVQRIQAFIFLVATFALILSVAVKNKISLRNGSELHSYPATAHNTTNALIIWHCLDYDKTFWHVEMKLC
jgi:hypothetical protein